MPTKKTSSGVNRRFGLIQQGLVESRYGDSSERSSTYNKEVKNSGKEPSNSITYKTNVIKSITNVLKRLANVENSLENFSGGGGIETINGQFADAAGELSQAKLFTAMDRGNANGVASLDAGGTVPAAQLPFSGLNYQGNWNADTNTPAIASGVGNEGEYFIVSTEGDTIINGISNWKVGDWIIFNGTTNTWEKLEGQEEIIVGNSVYVDRDEGNDATGTGQLGNPFATIGAGIAAAAAGDNLFIAKNIYPEDITIDKDLDIKGDFKVQDVEFAAGLSNASIEGEIELDDFIVNAAADNIKLVAKQINGTSAINGASYKINISGSVAGAVALAGDDGKFEVKDIWATITCTCNDAKVNIFKSAPVANQGVIVNGNSNKVNIFKLEVGDEQNGVDLGGNNNLVNVTSYTGTSGNAFEITSTADKNNINAQEITLTSGNGLLTAGPGDHTVVFGRVFINGTGNAFQPTGVGTLILKAEEINLDAANANGVFQGNAAFDCPNITAEINVIYLNADTTHGINLTSANNSLFTADIGKILKISGVSTVGINIEAQGSNDFEARVEFKHIEANTAIIVNGGADLDLNGVYIEGTTNCIITNNAEDVVSGFVTNKVGTDSVFAGSSVTITTPGGGATAGVPTYTLFVGLDNPPEPAEPNLFSDLEAAATYISGLPLTTQANYQFDIYVKQGTYGPATITFANPVDINIYLEPGTFVEGSIIYNVDDTALGKGGSSFHIICNEIRGSTINNLTFDLNGITMSTNVEFRATGVMFTTSLTEVNSAPGVANFVRMSFEKCDLGGVFALPSCGNLFYCEDVIFFNDGRINQLFTEDPSYVNPSISFVKCQWAMLTGMVGPSPWQIDFFDPIYAGAGGKSMVIYFSQGCQFVYPFIPGTPDTYVPFPFNVNANGGNFTEVPTIVLGAEEMSLYDNYALSFSETGGGAIIPLVDSGEASLNFAQNYPGDPTASINNGTDGVANGFHNGIYYFRSNGEYRAIYAGAGTTAQAQRPAAAASLNGCLYYNTDIDHMQKVVKGAWVTEPITVSKAEEPPESIPPGPISNPQEGDKIINTSTTPATEWNYTNGSWVALPRHVVKDKPVPKDDLTDPNEGDKLTDTSTTPATVRTYTNGSWVALPRHVVKATPVPENDLTDPNEGDKLTDTYTKPVTVWTYTDESWVALPRHLAEAAPAPGTLDDPNIGDTHYNTDATVVEIYDGSKWVTL